jgi:hypothetical protein
MNGAISVESRLGAGSVFTVRLPVWRETEEPTEKGLNQSAGSHFAVADKQEEIK